MDEIRFVDLFSGIGGFRLGLEKVGGFKHVWSCDINRYANTIYIKRFGEENHYTADIKGVNPEEIPDHDLLCGGFPCQSFSIAGRREGFKDTRGTLFFEILRIAEAKRPSLLLLENVRGLLSNNGGRTFSIMLQSLDELGYWIEWQVLNSKYYGVPQSRNRVFIIGHLRGTRSRPVFPILPTDKMVSRENTARRSGLLGMEISEALDSSYWKGPDGKRTMIALRRIRSEHGKKERRKNQARGFDRTPYTPESRVIVESKEKISGPLTAELNPDTLIKIGNTEYEGIRKFTPLECERLQGFPDNWTKDLSDTQRYKCLGNAVTVNVIEFLGHRIREAVIGV